MEINEKKGILIGAVSLLADVCDAAGEPTGKRTPEGLVGRIRRMRETLADIREAAGDPEGKLMQDELVARIRRMRDGLKQIHAFPALNLPIYKSNVKETAKEALQ